MDDECRGVRLRKKHTEPICCPVCSVTIRPHEIEQHLLVEVDRLHKLSVNKGRKSNVMSSSSSANASGSSGTTASSYSMPAADSNDSASEKTPSDAKECWAMYQKIKNNRNARLKVSAIDFKLINCLVSN